VQSTDNVESAEVFAIEEVKNWISVLWRTVSWGITWRNYIICRLFTCLLSWNNHSIFVLIPCSGYRHVTFQLTSGHLLCPPWQSGCGVNIEIYREHQHS
jgi:hypothetical protein